jgi:hypothetical protein
MMGARLFAYANQKRQPIKLTPRRATMATHDADRSNSALLELRRAAKALQRSMAKETGNHPPVHVDVRVTAVACTFIIIGKTLDEAYKHAKELTDEGCICTSSGDTEFTCVCGG